MHEKHQYDVAVIGGGPAGMMAAGRAAEMGAHVVLLEKNTKLGKKLLITGGGRCNVTNATFERRLFLEKFRGNKKFLHSPFSLWSVEDTLRFFHERNMPTKTEPENRVFPVSNTAQSVWDVLVQYMQDGGVVVRPNSVVTGLLSSDSVITGIELKSRKVVTAHTYIVATGGKSRPETGSTGDGFTWLRKLGHTIIEPDAALVPVKIREPWVKTLSGVSVRDAKLTVLQNDAIQQSGRGKMLFTHLGISGPLVLNMSRDIGELLKYGTVTVSIDLMPSIDPGTLDKQVQTVFESNKNKKIKNSLGNFVQPSLAPVLITLSGIDPEKQINVVNRTERLRLVRLMKGLPLTVAGLMGVDKAVVTSGGVKLEEIDFKSMQSRLFPNLYIVGDMLNIDRPSGGYSLQLCWTTGFVAGTHAVRR